jgi:hypothetical protein
MGVLKAALPLVDIGANIAGAVLDGVGAGEDAKGANAEDSGGRGGGNEFDNLLTTLINDLTGHSNSAPANSLPTATAAA